MTLETKDAGDTSFGDILLFEYLLFVSVSTRLKFVLKDDCSDMAKLAIFKSNNYSICARKILKCLIEECGELPCEEFLQLRYLVFECVDNFFFFQHHLCQISPDRHVGSCCEAHKIADGYRITLRHLEQLIAHPAFELDNAFSVFQIVFDLKRQLVVRQCKQIDELHLLAESYFDDCAPVDTCNSVLRSEFYADYVKQCSDFRDCCLAISEEAYETFVEDLRAKHPLHDFECHMRKFLVNYNNHLDYPALFQNMTPLVAMASSTAEDRDRVEEQADPQLNDSQPQAASSFGCTQLPPALTQLPVFSPSQTPSAAVVAPPITQIFDAETPAPVDAKEHAVPLYAASAAALQQENTQNGELAAFDVLHIDAPALLASFPGSVEEYRQVILCEHPIVKDFVANPHHYIAKPAAAADCFAASSSGSVEDGDHSPPRKKLRGPIRIPFSADETTAVVDGVQKYGRNWKRILESYAFHPKRTAVDIKDKARNLAISSHAAQA